MSLQDDIRKHLDEALANVKLTAEEQQIVERCQDRLVVAVESLIDDPELAKSTFSIAITTLGNLAVAKGIDAEAAAKLVITKTFATLLKFAFDIAV